MKKLNKILSYTIYVLLTCAFISCSRQTTEEKTTKHTKKTNSEIILFVERYEIEEGGMKYILYREVSGGLFILNITKDSLEVKRLRSE